MTIWMAYAIAVGVLAVGAGFAIDRAARALRLPTRFFWLGMLVLAIAAPVGLSVFAAPATLLVTPMSSAGPIEVRQAPTVAAPVSVDERILAAARTLDRPFIALWMILSTICLGRFIVAIIRLRRGRARWITRDIVGTTCFVTPDIGPAVVAMPTPHIVIPEWATALDHASLATVVRHEREHLLARDSWLIVMSSLALAAMPWNPAVWLIRRRLRLALEMDCDARVLAEEPRVDRYGSLLLAIAERPRLAAGLAATLTESTSDLERRIEAMTAQPPRHPRARAAVLALLSLTAIAFACTMPAPDLVDPEQVELAKNQASGFFDFQVEKPASADPSNPPPVYPNALREANIEGTVIAKFVVDTNGRVDERTFEISKSDHPLFTTAVRNAIPNMRFFPARVGGKAVKQLVRMPFTFSLVGKNKIAAGTIVPREPQVSFATPTEGSMPSALSSNAPPVYPALLRSANIEGGVDASFVVRPDGRADMSTFIVRRSDHEGFNSAVRRAVESWRFQPAMKDGKPVSAMMQVPFRFSLVR